MSDIFGLGAMNHSFPGNSSRGSRESQVGDLRSQAAALNRDGDETDGLAKSQRGRAAEYDQLAKEAKKDAAELRRQKGEVARLRYNAAIRQLSHCEEESRAAIRNARQLEYDADTRRAEARTILRQADAIERLTPDPSYKAETMPRYSER